MSWQIYARTDASREGETALFVIDVDGDAVTLLRFDREATVLDESTYASREEATEAAQESQGGALEWRRIPRWLGEDNDDLLNVLLPTVDEDDMDEDAWE